MESRRKTKWYLGWEIMVSSGLNLKIKAASNMMLRHCLSRKYTDIGCEQCS